MLPFPKRKTGADGRAVEMELDDDDLVVIEEDLAPAPSSSHVMASTRDDDLAKTRRRRSLPLPSTRPLDEALEDDIAGECLASIAAEVRSPQSASGIHALAPPPRQHDREISASYTIPPSARLPSVSSPPFVRSAGSVRSLADGFAAPGVRDARDSAPPPAFARRSSSQMRAAQPVTPHPRASEAPTVARRGGSEAPPSVSSVSSVAPVSLSSLPAEARTVEPTVIVLRERPKAGWIMASAAIGALCALAAAKIITTRDEPAAPAQPTSTTTIATAEMTGPVAPPAAVTAPTTQAAATPAPSPVLADPAPPPATAAVAVPAATTTGAVVRFGDEQGVAIAAPKPTATPSTTAKPSGGARPGSSSPRGGGKPAKPVRAPMSPLPDGSFPLGESKSAGAPAPSPTVAPAPSTPSQAEKAAQAALASTILPAANGTSGAGGPPAPEPPRRRALTPEQQIADAQLKASMK